MAGNSSVTHEIKITATDGGAARVIENVNRRVASLTASGERTTKALARFADVSGVSKITEGLQAIGRTAAETFRSLERTGGGLSGLIGGATVGAMAATMQQWAQTGQQLGRAAHALNLPVEQLSKMQNAAIAAGVPVGSITTALGHLQDMLYSAAYQSNPEAIRALKMLDIDPGTPGHVTDLATAWASVVKKIQSTGDVHTRQAMLDILGADRGLLPLIEEYQRFEEIADKSGANISRQQADHASAFAQAWDRLALNLRGIEKTILDDLSAFGTSIVRKVSEIIEANKKESVTATKWGIGALTVLSWNKLASWLSLPKIALGPVGAAGAGVYFGMTLGKRPLATQEQENAVMNRAPGTGAVGAPPRGSAPPALPPAPAVQGAGNLPAGITMGPDGLPLGVQTTTIRSASGATFQVRPELASRFQGLINDFEQRGYAIRTGGSYNRRFVAGTRTPSEHSFAGAMDFNPSENMPGQPHTIPDALARELAAKWGVTWGGSWGAGATPRDWMHFEQSRSAPAAPSAGQVLVDVHLHGAPDGTTAHLESSGDHVSAPPPSISSDPFWARA